jgi:hypothetical protein
VSGVTLRPFRPEDHEVVRRRIDDPVISGGFPTAAPKHGDAAVRAIVHDEPRSNLDRFAVVVDDRLVGEAQVRHSPPLIGFRNEGLLRRYLHGEGGLGDLVMYAMTRDDWERVRDGWISTG